ncbi:zinc finger SWIM domain-containing protein 3-like isoform X2 [Frankliniella occidentalis]|uniref:Zinc finger SWIM domain-containing protein 3-like isoform X2 n=1 Tax=Frankliniella occidentalis TaxID=133901 RepID=A0A9C6U4C4_FRAOC|nr:zinc finger SWIM domain-containing protein 3-like isoform X2 [Frankliniella occidentalis]
MEVENQSDWVPRKDQKFSAWTDVEEALEKYGERTNTTWVVGNSRLVADKNITLKAKNRPLIDEKLKYLYVTLTCKCGGRKRVGKGVGDRPNQSSWKIYCPGFIKFKYDGNVKKLIVDTLNLNHIHPTTPEVKAAFPESRRLTGKDAEAVQKLLKLKVKPTLIRMLLADESSKKLTARDISNLRASMKKAEMGGLTEEEKLLDTLQQLADRDPTSTIHLGQDDKRLLEFLFFQTSSMKNTLRKYPTLVIVDTTYKVNKNQMPVVVFMAMDGQGSGRVVGYAFVHNELKTTLHKVLDCLKASMGEETTDKIKVFVVDKDYSEIGAIKEVFPNARIQLCDFHVSKLFTKKASGHSEEVLSILTKLRYAEDDGTFQALVVELEEECDPELFTYFNDNWLKIPEAWCTKDRQDCLGNTTSNRLENHNGKIKMVLNHENSLYECIKGLLDLHQTKEDDVMFRDTMESIKYQYKIGNTDPNVQQILSDFHKLPAELMIQQLDLSTKVQEETLKEYGTSTGSCNCPFKMSYRLPCRHMIHLRQEKGDPPYHTSEIEDMWLQKEVEVDDNTAQLSSSIVAHRMPARIVPTDTQGRFQMALVIARKLCNVLGESGRDQYAQRLQVLKDLLAVWSSGKEAGIMTIHSTRRNTVDRSNTLTTVEEIQVNNETTMVHQNNSEVRDDEATSSASASKPSTQFQTISMVHQVNSESCHDGASASPSTSTTPVQRIPIVVVTQDGSLLDDDNDNILSSVAEGLDEGNKGQEGDDDFVILNASLPHDDNDDILSSVAEELDEGNKDRESDDNEVSTPGPLNLRNLNLMLPTSIKHKGRPKGIGKTTNYYKRIKGRPLCSSAKKGNARKERSLAISNEDVTKINKNLWKMLMKFS